MIVVVFEPVWLLIFFATLGLSMLCLAFGVSLIRRKPSRASTTSIGGFFIGQFVIFFTFPYIILDPILAIWSYKVQVIGFQVSTLFLACYGRSLANKISIRFLLIVAIPAVLISLVAWVITPFEPITVSYGYELNIEIWFFILLALYGFPPLIFLIIELVNIYRPSEKELRRRILILIISYVSLITSMTLLFTIIPVTLGSPEVKPIGILVSTVCVIGIYYGFRWSERNENR